MNKPPVDAGPSSVVSRFSLSLSLSISLPLLAPPNSHATDATFDLRSPHHRCARDARRSSLRLLRRVRHSREAMRASQPDDEPPISCSAASLNAAASSSAPVPPLRDCGAEAPSSSSSSSSSFFTAAAVAVLVRRRFRGLTVCFSLPSEASVVRWRTLRSHSEARITVEVSSSKTTFIPASTSFTTRPPNHSPLNSISIGD